MDFFAAHNYDALILMALTVFPRISLLLMGGPFMVLHWIGWIFMPRLVVAVLATNVYWETNPVLCIIAWFFALSDFFSTSDD